VKGIFSAVIPDRPDLFASLLARSSYGRDTPVIDESGIARLWLSMTTTTRSTLRFVLTAVASRPIQEVLSSIDETPAAQNSCRGRSFHKRQVLQKDSFYIYNRHRSYDFPGTETTDLVRFQASTVQNTYAYADDTNTGVRPNWSSPRR